MFAATPNARRQPSRSNVHMDATEWLDDSASFTTNSARIVYSEITQNARFSPGEFRELRSQFAVLSRLNDEWNGASSARPEPSIMAAASAYLEFALAGRRGAPVPRIVPVSDGSIQAEWYSKDYRFEMYFEADGIIAAWSENRQTGVEMDEEGPEAIQLLVDWLGNFEEDFSETV